MRRWRGKDRGFIYVGPDKNWIPRVLKGPRKHQDLYKVFYRRNMKQQPMLRAWWEKETNKDGETVLALPGLQNLWYTRLNTFMTAGRGKHKSAGYHALLVLTEEVNRMAHEIGARTVELGETPKFNAIPDIWGIKEGSDEGGNIVTYEMEVVHPDRFTERYRGEKEKLEKDAVAKRAERRLFKKKGAEVGMSS